MNKKESPKPNLDQLNKPTLTTEEAAFFLNRKVQTLRVWACYGGGPIRPRRIYGRLAWPATEIKALLGVQS